MTATRDNLIVAMASLRGEERTARACTAALENSRLVRSMASDITAYKRKSESCAATITMLEQMVDAGGPLTDAARGHVVEALTAQHDMVLRTMQTCDPSEFAEFAGKAASIASAIQIVRGGGI